MKTQKLKRVIIDLTTIIYYLIFCTNFVFANNSNSQLNTSQVPEGLTASEWGSIKSQIDPQYQQRAYLNASNMGIGDWFGFSVAVSENTVVVGAVFEGSSTTGVNSTPNNLASNSGAAYIFARNVDTGFWSEQAYLKASNTDVEDQFGGSVAISGDTVVVGTIYESSSTTGVNSIPNNLANSSGAAYVFIRDSVSDSWSQQAYLKASNTERVDFFGLSVSISEDTIVVGAIREDSSTTGVNTTPNNLALNSGAAYIFVRDSITGTWSQQAYLKASNTGEGDRFGQKVSVSGNTLVIGTPEEDSSTTGVGSLPDELAVDSGAAYVFIRDEITGTWSEQAYLKASNTESLDRFGEFVEVFEDTLVVGAVFEDSSSTGVNSIPDELAIKSGAAYVFARDAVTNNWSQQAYLKASNTQAGDYFGNSVGISEDMVVVGAPREDSSSFGVNSIPDELAVDSGAAYLFVRDEFTDTWSEQAYLKSSNTNQDQGFGSHVDISGNMVVVGAALENAGNITGSGAAYVFSSLESIVFLDGFE